MITEKEVQSIVSEDIICFAENEDNVGVIYLEEEYVKIAKFNINENENIYVSEKEFLTIQELINYLREVRFDYSLDFEIVCVLDSLISSLYKSGFIEMCDIV